MFICLNKITIFNLESIFLHYCIWNYSKRRVISVLNSYMPFLISAGIIVTSVDSTDCTHSRMLQNCHRINGISRQCKKFENIIDLLKMNSIPSTTKIIKKSFFLNMCLQNKFSFSFREDEPRIFHPIWRYSINWNILKLFSMPFHHHSWSNKY